MVVAVAVGVCALVVACIFRRRLRGAAMIVMGRPLSAKTHAAIETSSGDDEPAQEMAERKRLSARVVHTLRASEFLELTITANVGAMSLPPPPKQTQDRPEAPGAPAAEGNVPRASSFCGVQCGSHISLCGVGCGSPASVCRFSLANWSWPAFMAKLRILVITFQIIVSFAFTFNIRYPSNFLSFCALFSALNVSMQNAHVASTLSFIPLSLLGLLPPPTETREHRAFARVRSPPSHVVLLRLVLLRHSEVYPTVHRSTSGMYPRTDATLRAHRALCYSARAQIDAAVQQGLVRMCAAT